MKWAALVPELTVTDLERSLAFYTVLLGFEVVFDCPETRFAYLQLGEAQLMLDEYAEGQGWQTRINDVLRRHMPGARKSPS